MEELKTNTEKYWEASTQKGKCASNGLKTNIGIFDNYHKAFIYIFRDKTHLKYSQINKTITSENANSINHNSRVEFMRPQEWTTSLEFSRTNSVSHFRMFSPNDLKKIYIYINEI